MTTKFRLINGDCCDVLQRIPRESIDLVVTDPPYLVNYRSRDGRQLLGDHSGNSWLDTAFLEISRVLKSGRYCISFYGWSKAEKFLAAWRQADLYPVGQFVFSKSYASSRTFTRNTHECAYLLAKGSPRKPNMLLKSVQSWKYTGNKLHPTQKSPETLKPLIEAFSDPGEIVLDPFCGSGSTGHAASQLGRHFFGIELDSEYYRIAKEAAASENAVK